MAPEQPAPDPEQHRQELRALFNEHEYSKGDVILATEVTEKALEHMTKPGGPLLMQSVAAKRQGRSMKFSGADILRIEVMRRLQFFGIPHYSLGSSEARDAISKRVQWDLAGMPGGARTLLLYPYITPDQPDRTQWAVTECREGEREPYVPPATLIVGVDEFIEQVVAKLRALRDDTEMPRFHPLHEEALHLSEQLRASKSTGVDMSPPVMSAGKAADLLTDAEKKAAAQ